ncbi:MAG: hypothetical protein U9O82_01480, partial [Thermodesulfobacteriota bacterium]|nr:hypothetical protein [Thermodesulfobacteriota bacterium]
VGRVAEYLRKFSSISLDMRSLIFLTIEQRCHAGWIGALKCEVIYDLFLGSYFELTVNSGA